MKETVPERHLLYICAYSGQLMRAVVGVRRIKITLSEYERIETGGLYKMSST